MEHQRKAVGGGTTSIYRNPRRRRRQARIRATGSAFEGLRSGAEWLGAGIGEHAYPQPGIAGARVRAVGTERRAAEAALRIFSGRADVWHASARWNRTGD